MPEGGGIEGSHPVVSATPLYTKVEKVTMNKFHRGEVPTHAQNPRTRERTWHSGPKLPVLINLNCDEIAT